MPESFNTMNHVDTLVYMFIHTGGTDDVGCSPRYMQNISTYHSCTAQRVSEDYINPVCLLKSSVFYFQENGLLRWIIRKQFRLW